MTDREHVEQHLKEQAAHHAEKAKQIRKRAASHEALAKSHAANQETAQHFRDLASCDKAEAAEHESQQASFEAKREQLAAGSGATVFDSHEDSTRDMQDNATSDFLKRCGVLQD